MQGLGDAIRNNSLNDQQRQWLDQHYLLNHSEEAAEVRGRLRQARQRYCEARDAIPEIMVMREMPEARQASMSSVPGLAWSSRPSTENFRRSAMFPVVRLSTLS